MKKKICYLMFLVPGFLSAQDSTIVSLADCHLAALNSSHLLKNAERMVDLAKLDLKTSKGAAMPAISLQAAGIYGFNALVPAVPPFWSGSLSNLYGGGLFVSQPVYAGGRLRVAADMAGVAIQMRNLGLGFTTDSLVIAVSMKYWQLVSIQEEQKILLANGRLLEFILKLQQDLLAQGMVAHNDELKIAVQLSKLRLAMMKTEHSRLVAVQELCDVTGMPYREGLFMRDTLSVGKRELLPPPDTSVISGRRIMLSNFSTDLSRLDIKYRRGALRPTISSGFNAIQIGSFGGGGSGRFLPMATLTVHLPLSEHWAGGRFMLKKAELAASIREDDRMAVVRQVKLELNKTWYAWMEARAEVKLAEELGIQAVENLRVVQDAYCSGVASISEVIEAQALHQQAQSQLIAALAALKMRRDTYDFLLQN